MTADQETDPSAKKVIVAAGTYDGVLAGWELNPRTFKFSITFAAPVHDGSIRSLTFANKAVATGSTSCTRTPSCLLSSGYDEMLKTHDFTKHVTSSGELRTPVDFGTPVCSSFAPPASPTGPQSTHCLVGFSGGKLVIYKKRDWVVQHVLAGHDGAMASLAVHPSGKLALTGGETDGKIKLWDLMKGRLSFVTKIQPAVTSVQGRIHYEPIVSLVWSPGENDAYAYACGSHITVRDVATGKDLLDVDMPSRVNQICLLKGNEGMFVAAACNDGSLPVLAVNDVTGKDKERRAILAIEPVEGPVAGEERFKCIQRLYGYYVLTASSAGVISLMNLQGAVNMILADAAAERAGTGSSDETPVHPETDDADSDDDEQELAVDIIDSIQLGSGARITCLATWLSDDNGQIFEESIAKLTTQNIKPVQANLEVSPKAQDDDAVSPKRKRQQNDESVKESEALSRARELVAKAKVIQQRKDKKRQKNATQER